MNFQNDDTISKIVALANALETTHFNEFWAMASGASKEVVALGVYVRGGVWGGGGGGWGRGEEIGRAHV